MIAQRLGMSLADFEVHRTELEQRGFPGRDPTTGRYCIEAVDRWRLRRFPRLFPELTAIPTAVDAWAAIPTKSKYGDPMNKMNQVESVGLSPGKT
jgi:hypothetical protein